MDPKSARKLLRRVSIPKVEIPGIIRPTTLFRLSDIDEALARYRVETPAQDAGVDIGQLVDEIVRGKAGS
jgi:hypothetical protein